ncbi:MAG: flavin reductase family protein [Anaerolineales bacterium]|nr:flavin reductase family protein [Anaerolineales bacterium]
MTVLEADDLRSAMRAWSAGVTVVTVSHEGEKHGMTVNSFTSISLDPPLIVVSLQQHTRTHELVLKEGTFGVTILSAKQVDVSDLFAGRKPQIEDRVAAVRTETLVSGAPLIVGGLSWFDCRIRQTYDSGATTLIIAEVLAARAVGAGEPLIYHNREYGRLSKIK